MKNKFGSGGSEDGGYGVFGGRGGGSDGEQKYKQNTNTILLFSLFSKIVVVILSYL